LSFKHHHQITMSLNISSLLCNAGMCTFTRVNTNASAIVPPDYYKTLPLSIVTGAGSTSSTVATTTTSSNKNGIRRHLKNTTTIDDALIDSYTLNDDNFFGFPDEKDSSSAPWFLPKNQDKLSPKVALTRDYSGGIFNALAPYDTFNGPVGTEWALLPDNKTLADTRCSLTFCSWDSCFAQYDYQKMIGKPGVVHLIEEDLYYNIKFTKWTSDFNSFSFIGPGGGFQYVRDEKPLKGADLGKCPACDLAKASPAQLLGPIDNAFVNVTIQGLSANTTVSIKGVAQGQSARCNLRPTTNATTTTNLPGYGSVLPNARINADGKSVGLRRFRVAGDLTPFTYTVYIRATNAAGSCDTAVSVCVPPPGFTSCGGVDDVSYGTDATATAYCEASYVF
jgi:hypothetical protein